MEKVIIDTNIYYALIDLFPNSKIKAHDLSSHEKYITSVTLYESIIKNKNNLLNLKKITTSLIDEDFKLISIGYAPFSNESIYKIHHSNKIEDINLLLDEVLKFRIEKESEFARWFFFQIIIIVLGVLSKVEKYSFKNCNSKSFEFNKSVVNIMESYEEELLVKFRKTLNQAYIVDNTKKVFNNTFYQSMNEILSKFIRTYYEVEGKIHHHTDDKFFKLSQNENNIFSFLSQRKYKKDIENHINFFIDEFNTSYYEKTLNDKGKRFIEIKLKKIFYDKSKLFKNDIFDFLISLAISDDYNEIDKPSYSLTKELGYI